MQCGLLFKFSDLYLWNFELPWPVASTGPTIAKPITGLLNLSLYIMHVVIILCATVKSVNFIS